MAMNQMMKARRGGPPKSTDTLPSAKAAKSGVTPKKAKAILSDGETRGNPLTPAQKGLFGAIAGMAGQPRAAKRPAAIGERPIPARTQARMSAAATGRPMPRRSKA
jgi:hypothetical protein